MQQFAPAVKLLRAYTIFTV